MAVLVALSAWPAYPDSGAVGARGAVAPSAQDEEDLDAFMEKVLRRRVTNWEDLYRYTVRDRESFTVDGPGGETLGSYRGEYTWYVRDGFMIRSPHKVDGHTVSDKERQDFEEKFLRRMRRREEKRQERAAEAAEAASKGEDGADDEESLDREYFLGFPFEPGNYFVAGHEDVDGMRLLKVEYYPERLFTDEDEEEEEDPEDLEWARRFQKTSLVTMWILPEEHQIVRIAYDNIGLDFLPLRWLLQVDDVSAELTMFKPFPDLDVWLPRGIRAGGAATAANGTYSFEYALEYYDYKEAEVAAKVMFRLPGVEQQRE